MVILIRFKQDRQHPANRVGPIAQYHENSKYCSAVKPKPNKRVDNNLAHVTIQISMYRGSFEQAL